MIRRVAVFNVLVLAFFGLTSRVFAQSNPNLEIGLRPYGSYEGGKIDTVSLTNGNLMLHIPLFSYPQRGSLPANMNLTYNNKNWYVHSACSNGTCIDQWKWNPLTPSGVYFNFDGAMGISYTLIKPNIYIWTLYTSDGGSHLMSTDTAGGYHTVDGTGIYYNGANPTNGLTPLGLFRDGSKPLNSDSNGNLMTSTGFGYMGPPGAFQSVTLDTLGRNPYGSATATTDYSGCIQPASPNQISLATIITYPGTNRLIKMCAAQYSLKTNFQQYDANAGVQIYEGSATAWFMVSAVLYNGSSWTSSPAWGFDYVSRDTGDPSTINYGDLSKVTLPTGGTITYTWNTANLCDIGVLPSPVSRSVASRIVDAQDGSGPQSWTYKINWAPLPTGSGSVYGTIVTDPAGNQSVHGMTTYGVCTYYEIQTNYFSGLATSGALLKTIKTDYISSTAPYGANINPTPAANVLPIRTTTD